jgi:transcription elongation GreA/GreB family factor
MLEAGIKETFLENAEYEAAKEAQGMLELKIAKLKEHNSQFKDY